MPRVMHCNFFFASFPTHSPKPAAKKCSAGIFLFPFPFSPGHAASNCCIFCGTCVAVIWFTRPRLDRRQENWENAMTRTLAAWQFDFSFPAFLFGCRVSFSGQTNPMIASTFHRTVSVYLPRSPGSIAFFCP